MHWYCICGVGGTQGKVNHQIFCFCWKLLNTFINLKLPSNTNSSQGFPLLDRKCHESYNFQVLKVVLLYLSPPGKTTKHLQYMSQWHPSWDFFCLWQGKEHQSWILYCFLGGILHFCTFKVNLVCLTKHFILVCFDLVYKVTLSKSLLLYWKLCHIKLNLLGDSWGFLAWH